jgi:hypothetical protein
MAKVKILTVEIFHDPLIVIFQIIKLEMLLS